MLERKKDQHSPGLRPDGGKDRRKVRMAYMKRGHSNDSIQFLKKPLIQNQPGSDFTISSIDNKDGVGDQSGPGSNSIISEEDSAFEDQTPAHGTKKALLKPEEAFNPKGRGKNGSINVKEGKSGGFGQTSIEYKKKYDR